MTSSTDTHGHGVVCRTDLIIAAILAAGRAALVAVAIYIYVALARPDDDAIIVLVCATLSSVAGFAFFGHLRPGTAACRGRSGQGGAHHAGRLRGPAELQRVGPAQEYQTARAATLFCRWYLNCCTGRLSSAAYADSHLFARPRRVSDRLCLLSPRSPNAMAYEQQLGGSLLVGALGGITGATAAFPGAFVTIWCGAHGWDKVRQRAIYQPFILGMQLVTLAVMVPSSPTVVVRPELLQYVAPAMLGSYVGLWGFSKLSTAQFNRVVSGLLLVSGVAMLLKGL